MSDERTPSGGSGAFYYNGNASGGFQGGSGTERWIEFNASRSSTVYGASSTVQPPSIQLIAQIKY